MNNLQKQNFAPINSVNQQSNSPLKSQPVPAQTLKAPMNVQDILNRLHNSENQNQNNTSETQEETSSNNDRIVNSSPLNTSERKKGRKKKDIMTIM